MHKPTYPFPTMEIIFLAILFDEFFVWTRRLTNEK